MHQIIPQHFFPHSVARSLALALAQSNFLRFLSFLCHYTFLFVVIVYFLSISFSLCVSSSVSASASASVCVVVSVIRCTFLNTPQIRFSKRHRICFHLLSITKTIKLASFVG